MENKYCAWHDCYCDIEEADCMDKDTDRCAYDDECIVPEPLGGRYEGKIKVTTKVIK